VAGAPFSGANMGGIPPQAQVEASQRVQSNRVYVILFGVIFMVCTLALTAVWIHQLRKGSSDAEEVVATVVQPPTNKGKSPYEAEDTGEPAPQKTSTSSSRSSSRSHRSSSSSSSSSTTAPAPPKGGPGAVSIRMSSDQGVSAIEIRCPKSGFQDRRPLSGGKVVIPNVPAESCTLYLKGGPPGQHSVTGNRSYKCSIQATTLVCK
jgi:hypothetical protein